MPRQARFKALGALLGLALLCMPACGGGGGGSAPGGASEVPVVFDGPVYQAFTAFDGLVGAAVDIYTYETLGQGPRHIVPTVDDGSFGVPQYLVTPGSLIVVRVRGGVGTSPEGPEQTNQGAFYALFTPEQLEGATATVSLGTTALYLRLRHLLATNAPADDVVRQLHDRARCMLTGDLNGDLVEDANDVAGDQAGAVDAMLDAALAPTGYDGSITAIFAGDPIPYHHLLRASEPQQPQLITVDDTIATGAQITRTLGVGTLAIVASHAGVTIYRYDPNETPALARLGHFDPVDEIQDIALRGNVLFALGFQGIETFDITDPAAVVALDAIELTASIQGVQFELVGDVAYCAMSASGIMMVDISDPENLAEVGTPIAGDFFSVSSRGRTLFATGPTNGKDTFAFDLTNPTAPTYLGFTRTHSARAVVATTESEAVTIGLGQWSHVDRRATGSIWSQPDFDVPMASQNWPADSRLYDDIIVTAHWGGTVSFLDVHDRRYPTTIPSITAPGTNGNGSVARADSACVTDHGLFVFQPGHVSVFTWDPLARRDPILSRTYIGPGSTAAGVQTEGTRCYLSSGPGIRIFDLDDPTAPTARGTSDGGPASEACLVGTTLYTGSSYGTMQIYDVSDPDNPTHEKSVGGRYRGFDVDGDRLYTGRDGDFAVLDISDRLNPALLGTYDMTVASAAMHMGGSLVYAADRYARGYTRVIDVSNPLMPAQVTAVGPASHEGRPGLIERLPNDHLLIGGFNINSNLGAQLQILDVSDPSTPVEVGESFTPGVRHTDMAVRHGFAYISCGRSIRIIDVRDVRDPWVVGTVPAPRSWGIDTTPACGVAAVDDWGMITFRSAVREVP